MPVMDEITKEQPRQLWDKLGPSMRLLQNVYLRLDERGYQPGNELFDAAQKAWESIHSLSIRAHYLACQSGIGESATRPNSAEQGES